MGTNMETEASSSPTGPPSTETSAHDPAAALGQERSPFAIIVDVTRTIDQASGKHATRLGFVAAGENGPAFLANTYVHGTSASLLVARALAGPDTVDLAALERNRVHGLFCRLRVTVKPWRSGPRRFVRVDRVEGLDAVGHRRAALKLCAWDWLLDEARGRVDAVRIAAAHAQAEVLGLDARELAAHLLVIEESDAQASVDVNTPTGGSP